jgi:hypothetical protein
MSSFANGKQSRRIIPLGTVKNLTYSGTAFAFRVIRMVEGCFAEPVSIFSADVSLYFVVFGVAYSILPDSVAVAEGAPEAINYLHRITHNLMIHAPIFEETCFAGRTVHIANPDLYTNKGKLTES